MLLVLGSVNVDLVVRSARLPAPGETVLGGRFFQAGGGKGANQAVAAARSGADVTFLGAVGNDAFGKEARSALQREGIDCRFLRTLKETPTGVALILVSEHGENCISVASGANALVDESIVTQVTDAEWQRARVLLACLEVPWPTVLRAFQMAQRYGVRTILNPAPVIREFLEDPQLECADLLTPNEHEAAQLSGITIRSPDDAVQAGQVLRQRGAKNVLITLGAAGVVLVGKSIEHFPATDVRAVDTTAAGDAFSGALAAHWAETDDLVRAIRFATAAAGPAVTREGAQPSLPYRREVELQIRS